MVWMRTEGIEAAWEGSGGGWEALWLLEAVEETPVFLLEFLILKSMGRESRVLGKVSARSPTCV